jgi:hypothetical protein
MEIILGIVIYLIGVVVAMASTAWFNSKGTEFEFSPVWSIFSWIVVAFQILLLLALILVGLMMWLNDIMYKPYKWFYDKFNK